MMNKYSLKTSGTPSVQKIFLHILTSESSFLSSQEPDSFPYSDLDQSKTRISTHAICFKIQNVTK